MDLTHVERVDLCKIQISDNDSEKEELENNNTRTHRGITHLFQKVLFQWKKIYIRENVLSPFFLLAFLV